MQQFRKTLVILLAIGITFGFQSCKKDEETPTKTELLTTEGGWTLENSTGNADEIADALIAVIFEVTPTELQTPEYEEALREGFDLEDFFEFEDCEKDDITFFKTDGSMLEDQGAIKCDSNSPQSSPIGTWSCSADEKQLIVIDTDGEIQTFEVITINSSTLTLQLNMSLEENLDLEDFGDLEGLEGYDELLTKDFTMNFTFRAN